MGKKKTSWRAEGVPAWNVGTEERTGYYTYWRRNKAWDISLEDLEKKKKASKGKAIKRNQTLAIKNKHARKSTARKLKPQPGQQPTRPVGN
jgi:hypothetical protein